MRQAATGRGVASNDNGEVACICWQGSLSRVGAGEWWWWAGDSVVGDDVAPTRHWTVAGGARTGVNDTGGGPGVVVRVLVGRQGGKGRWWGRT